jgi:hypothetical protein
MHSRSHYGLAQPSARPSARVLRAPLVRRGLRALDGAHPYCCREYPYPYCDYPYPYCEYPYPYCDNPYPYCDNPYPYCDYPYPYCDYPYPYCDYPYPYCDYPYPYCNYSVRPVRFRAHPCGEEVVRRAEQVRLVVDQRRERVGGVLLDLNIQVCYIEHTSTYIRGADASAGYCCTRHDRPRRVHECGCVRDRGSERARERESEGANEGRSEGASEGGGEGGVLMITSTWRTRGVRYDDHQKRRPSTARKRLHKHTRAQRRCGRGDTGRESERSQEPPFSTIQQKHKLNRIRGTKRRSA